MSTIDDIKSKIDIVDLVAEAGVKLRHAGRNHTGFCPFSRQQTHTGLRALAGDRHLALLRPVQRGRRHLQVRDEQGRMSGFGARFADADFFVREDVRHPLEYHRSQLSGLTFYEGTGNRGF